MISIENLSKRFGPQILFQNMTFKVNSRERVGLVGRNGHGKTTLLRIITGDASCDDGRVVIPKSYRLGYVQQEIVFSKDTILEESMQSLPASEKGHHWKAEKILAGLGFSATDMNRPPREFSGGYQVRLNLAKVLVSEPDMLLLDEPTNYLDITSIRWIIRFLKNWPRELILITHDRGFMDQVVTHIVGIHRKTVRKIPGTTEKYYSQMAQEEEVYEKTRLNEERKKKEIENFISRFRAKARLANLVQSRVKTLAKMEKKDKLERIKTLDFSFLSKPFAGKRVATIENLHFSYENGKPIIDGLNFTIEAGDRICVVGKNGKGKTTLLKLLSEKLTSQNGKIDYHPKVTAGYFEQTNIKNLVDDRTVVEEILYSHEDVNQQMARNICGAMMFEGESALKKIGVLSGGEKSRVMLGKLLAMPLNLLLLDEPTNHLDMESCDALLAAIDFFEGTVVMVTHNEMFLQALARRMVVFQKDSVEVFEGSYQRFLAKRGWEEEAEKEMRNKNVSPAEEGNLTKKEIRRMRSEIVQRRSKTLKPLEKEMSRLEDDIDSMEQKLKTLNSDMLAASGDGDGVRIADLSKAIHDLQKGIDDKFEKLEVVTNSYEKQRADFDEQFESLGIDDGGP